MADKMMLLMAISGLVWGGIFWFICRDQSFAFLKWLSLMLLVAIPMIIAHGIGARR